jgi:hypothetical protein
MTFKNGTMKLIQPRLVPHWVLALVRLATATCRSAKSDSPLKTYALTCFVPCA